MNNSIRLLKAMKWKSSVEWWPTGYWIMQTCMKKRNSLFWWNERSEIWNHETTTWKGFLVVFHLINTEERKQVNKNKVIYEILPKRSITKIFFVVNQLLKVLHEIARTVTKKEIKSFYKICWIVMGKSEDVESLGKQVPWQILFLIIWHKRNYILWRSN